jgi:hypothetical protein
MATSHSSSRTKAGIVSVASLGVHVCVTQPNEYSTRNRGSAGQFLCSKLVLSLIQDEELWQSSEIPFSYLAENAVIKLH